MSGADGRSGLDLKALSKRCHSLVMDYFNDPDGAEVRYSCTGPSKLYSC